MTRLNKFITDSGYCSRREADAYIAQGRVTVNGVDASIGTSVDEGDVVEVDGERVGRKPTRHVYIAFNKPVGVTCTTDRDDKTNIIDFINYKERIFPVGRLDKDSNGLIILTNNGDIVNKILRAGNNNPKEYVVTVDKPITGDFVQRMSSGVRIMGVTTKPCEVIKRGETKFTIFLTQGLNRQIRRMCAVLGYTVVSLRRLRVMNITLGGLEVGKWRYFTAEETAQMHALLERSSGTEEASAIPEPSREGSRGGRSMGGSTRAGSRSATGTSKGPGRSGSNERAAAGSRSEGGAGQGSKGGKNGGNSGGKGGGNSGGKSGGSGMGGGKSGGSGGRSYNDFRRRGKPTKGR